MSTMSGYSASSTETVEIAVYDTNRKPPQTSNIISKFRLRDDGSHEHRLYDGKRKDGLLDLLQDKLRVMKEATLAEKSTNAAGGITPALPTHRRSQTAPVTPTVTTAAPSPSPTRGNSSASLVERYGTFKEQVGRGSSGTVKVSFKPHCHENPGRLFAVKRFECRPTESPKKYMKRVAAEFCISSSLNHPNVIVTLDLIRDVDDTFCEVMEYCSGGDVFSRVRAAGKLCAAEAGCYFKQLLRGLEYLHETGVAHRDIKPDNFLLTGKGALKIADFGNSECFRLPWQEKGRMSTGICGSLPYISPEQFTEKYFDPRSVDVWSAGVVYMDMRTGRHMWRLAIANKDLDYRDYLHDRAETGVYDPIEELNGASCRDTIYSMLNPSWRQRPLVSTILQSKWVEGLKVCDAGERGN